MEWTEQRRWIREDLQTSFSLSGWVVCLEEFRSFFPRPPKHSPSNKDRYSCKAHEIVSFCSFDSIRTMSSPPSAEWVSNKKTCFLYPCVLLHQRKPFHCYAWSYHFINGVQMAMTISLLSVIAIKFSYVLSWQLSESTMDVQSTSVFNVSTCCFIVGSWTSTGP